MLKKLINHKTKLISLTHISNVLGIIYPIEEVIKTAKEFSIPVMIDGAQSAPHIKINLENLSPTFFVFSAHKMLGPNGVGFVFIEKEFSKTMEPFLGGGGMITSVKKYSSEYQPVPLLFEGGTIDYPGVIAFSAALEYLDKVGMENIRQHEQILTKKITETLTSHPVIQLFGTTSIKDKIGLVSFNIKNVHPHDVNTVLDNEGILVRSGHHCAQVLMEKFNVMGTVRVSLYLYNTLEEVEKFAQAVEKAINIFKSIGTL
jgi:cysteine desulfurase/selenocysteine lyase